MKKTTNQIKITSVPEENDFSKKYTQHRPLTKREKVENKKLIHRLISIIENTYASFGRQVKVVEVHIWDEYISFAIAITVGTKVEKITSLDKDIALAISSPTGTVDIHSVPGRDLIYIDVPKGKTRFKKGKYKIIKIYKEVSTPVVRESEFYHDFKMLLRVILIRLGNIFYWLESKVPRTPRY